MLTELIDGSMFTLVLKTLNMSGAFLWNFFFGTGSRLFLGWIGLYFLVGGVIYWRAESAKGREISFSWTAIKETFAYVFPRNIYFSKSSQLDFKLFFFFVFFLNLAFFEFENLSGQKGFMNSIIVMTIGSANAGIPASTNFITNLSFSLAALLVSELTWFLIHWASHRIEWFWEFHKIHHSAPELHPISAYRFHFAEGLLLTLAVLVSVALVKIAFLVFGANPSEVMLMNGLPALVAFSIIVGNFRHSHIWLHFPKSVCGILMSPAMHQIHHSVELKHRDKNYGFYLSIYDWILGSLYIPNKSDQKNLRFGVDADQRHLHSNIGVLKLTFISTPMEVFYKIFGQTKSPSLPAGRSGIRPDKDKVA